MSHDINSSKFASPIPCTIQPNALELTVRTSGTGSSKQFFNPGIIAGRYGDKSYKYITDMNEYIKNLIPVKFACQFECLTSES